MFELVSSEQGLCLVTTENTKLNPIFVDFLDKSLNHRRKYLRHSKDGLVKALHNKQKQLRILDTTAGLGQDSFLLASLGHTVIMLERNPTIAALLKDGMDRAKDHPEVGDVLARMQLVHQDSCTYMHENDGFDIVYCDPMFPESKKSRLPKKGMQALSVVVGADHDSSDLITMALTKVKKVVVKRPRLAPPLHPNPHHQYSYQACRFDIYIK